MWLDDEEEDEEYEDNEDDDCYEELPKDAKEVATAASVAVVAGLLRWMNGGSVVGTA